MVRPCAMAASSKPSPVVLKPASASESPAEVVKDGIPGPHSHPFGIRIQCDWGQPQEVAYAAGTQLILMKTVQRELFEKLP